MAGVTVQTTDEVSAQLRDLERQGSGMAKFAHVCAGLLLVAGSLGSLISISAQAFERFLAAAQTGRLDMPNLLNTIVGVLLVLAGDAALLYAANMLRVLRSAQAPGQEVWLHAGVMLVVSAMEAGTYLYMAWLFDRPTTLVLWLIDTARAVAWPGLCAYLSLARPLPVGPRDISYQASLAAGRGVVRDVTRLAGDPAAPLVRKVRIYNAAARMSPSDRAQFAAIIEAVDEPTESPAESFPRTPEPPTSGRPLWLPREEGTDTPAESFREQTDHAPLRVISGARAHRESVRQNRSRKEQLRPMAYAALDEDPTLTRRELRNRLRCQQQTANALYAAWKLDRRQQTARRA